MPALTRRAAASVHAAAAAVLRRHAPARRAALRAAAARRHAMVLVYHRLAPEAGPPDAILPPVPTALFRQHLELLGDLGDLVQLAEAVRTTETLGRVRFAVTFDDDEPSHVQHALPALGTLGAPATFFLAGRALCGLGAPWWVALEQMIAERGLAATCHALGVAAATPATLAARCEGTPLARRLEQSALGDGAPLLDPASIRALGAADGVTIGFHTLRHPVLTGLADAELRSALVEGRAALADAVGRPVELLAYPHGRADRRVAAAARAAGYAAAVTGRRRPVGPRSDRFALGRWEPGALSVDDLAAEVAVRLNYPAAAPRG